MKYMIAISSLLSLSLCAVPLKQRIEEQKKQILYAKKNINHNNLMNKPECYSCSSTCSGTSCSSGGGGTPTGCVSGS